MYRVVAILSHIEMKSTRLLPIVNSYEYLSPVFLSYSGTELGNADASEAVFFAPGEVFFLVAGFILARGLANDMSPTFLFEAGDVAESLPLVPVIAMPINGLAKRTDPRGPMDGDKSFALRIKSFVGSNAGGVVTPEGVDIPDSSVSDS